MSIVVLINTSPSIALGGRLGELAEELRELLPDLDFAVERLNAVEERFCKPLLLEKPEELEERFKRTLPLFTLDLVSAMLPFSRGMFVKAEEDASALLRIKELEKEVFGELRLALERATRERGVNPEPVVAAHAAAVDYDLWLIDMVVEYGLYGFAERLAERASEMCDDLAERLYSLFYVVMCVDAALLGGAPYDEGALGVLVEWCSYYAEEVEDYLDTLIFLIPDEEYEAVREFLKSEVHG